MRRPVGIRGATRRYLVRTWDDGMEAIEHRLLDALPPSRSLLDVGSGDGTLTLLAQRRTGARLAVGVDVDPTFDAGERPGGRRFPASEVRASVSLVVGSVDHGLPFEDESFDLVVSNQVIEHLFVPDQMVAETRRVLKPGGHAVIATENLAAWHNVLSLAAGWDPFSMSFSKRERLGNPLSPHAGTRPASLAMVHKGLPTARSLRELFLTNGFSEARVFGGGYPPFPRVVSRSLSRVFPRHAHFIGVRARKAA